MSPSPCLNSCVNNSEIDVWTQHEGNLQSRNYEDTKLEPLLETLRLYNYTFSYIKIDPLCRKPLQKTADYDRLKLTVRLSCVWGPCVCLASMSQLAQTCCLFSPSSAWVTRATVHTHFQEERPAVTSRDDRSSSDPSRRSTTHQGNADVTRRSFFQGLHARARLGSNQECDQVNLCIDLIAHSNHIMRGKPGNRYFLWRTLAFRSFLVRAFSSLMDCVVIYGTNDSDLDPAPASNRGFRLTMAAENILYNSNKKLYTLKELKGCQLINSMMQSLNATVLI